MAELIMIGFEGIHRAAEVLDQIEKLDEEWTIDLRDAVAVYRTPDGKLRVQQSVLPTSREQGAWAGLLGGLLGGLLAAPFTMGASAAVAASAIGLGAVTLGATGAVIGAEDAAQWKEEYGISEDFVEVAGGMVRPGQSAVVVLARTDFPDVIAERFRGYGGKVLRTTLSPLAAARLQETLAYQGTVAA
ncbi:MAG TPA: DUF1269 domain-containing protein [Longimicrobiaceae bacterium]